jgi:hypothetical protein
MSMTDTPTTEPSAKSWSLLAKEAFGDQFHGEVHQPPETPAEPAEKPDEVVAETPSETPETTEQLEEVPISSLHQIAEKFELDPDWLDTVEVDVKINGTEGKAKLADLKKSYQITQAAEQRLEEAKTKAKTEHQAITQRREALNAEYTKVASLVGQAEQLLLQDIQKTDWDKLRANDPAEYSARKSEHEERRNAIERLKASAIQSYQTTVVAGKQESDQQRQAYLLEEREKLQSRVPEWKDADVARKESQELASYLMANGLSKDEVENAADHRLIVMARKAMLFDRGQNKTELAKKKVLTIPKVMKPGTKPNPEQSKNAQIMNARNRLKKSGSVEDALAVLRLKGK